jgi:galactokinase
MHTRARSSRFHIIDGTPHNLPDVAEFLTLLSTLNAHPAREARELFDGAGELFITRAPGRLDVMGGIADYSGSLVLELSIAEATLSALQRDASRKLKIVSLTSDRTREAAFEMSLNDFEREGRLVDYDEARALFQMDATRSWAAYVAGVFLVLMRERGVHFDAGARILLASSVPEGKGVSSSAAIEVAVMSAVAAAFDLDITPRDLALLCQKVENAVVGAPCGVMDQMTAACGAQGDLLALLCQPAELQGTITLPADLAVWGVDSGVRHSVGGGDYGSVRTGAFMGYRIIADLANLKVKLDNGAVQVEDEIWHGYLANITPSEFESLFAAQLPESITGSEFLARYGGTTDTVTRVEAERTYAVLKPTAHAVYEHFRVRAFAELLRSPQSARRNEVLGELMYQSHASYSACGLGSEGTDLLVQLVREQGAREGLYGAKITGGGSGGTVAVLGSREAEAAIRRVAMSYQQATNHKPHVFAGSSPGSATFGHLKLRRETAKL